MDIFSNLQVIGECLLDKKRTEAFRKSISRVAKNKTVLDAGTGSAVLAMFAAKSGAKNVSAIEIAPDIVKIARQNVKKNGLDNKIDIIQGDITQISGLDRADMFVCEMMDTGLIAEQQARAVNNLINNNVVDQNTICIPSEYFTYIQLINYNFNFYDLVMPFIIQARNYGASRRINKTISKPVLFDKLVFNKLIPISVNTMVNIKPIQNGVVNAVKISSRVKFDDHIIIGSTPDMNMPVVIPLNKQMSVRKGEQICVKISFKRGAGFDNVVVGLA